MKSTSFPTRALAAGVAGSALVAAPLALTAGPASAAGTTIDVAVTGNDANPGTPSAPLRTVQAAVDKAVAGTTIKIHKGVYDGQIKIRKSGTASAPITVTNAGDGAVTLTSTQPMPACSSNQPDGMRTILIIDGSDYWTFQGLNIVNGVYATGSDAGNAFTWHNTLVEKGDWQTRRKVPGAGSYSPTAAKQVIPYLRTVTKTPTLDSADGIKFLNNTITKKGLFFRMSSYGVVSGNKITDVACGTGPGVWLITFSNGWQVTKNDVSKIAPSTWKHFMQEGIRLGTSSNYNSVTNNNVHDLAGDGRAYNTDVDSSWNTFSGNKATNVAIGYNDQMSGWGNVWKNNSVTSFRTYGFGVRLMDGKLTLPSYNSSANKINMTCNVVSKPVGTAKSFGVGGTMYGTYAGNAWTTAQVGKNVAVYWGKYGNTWNGTKSAPPKTFAPSSC
ncbi:MAG TPA: DUF1565 domain-containing protein [Tetrasphaera sp.]|uniref:DUF1565 domain-containing protein n=1 Tax=Nostocoides sp. TaxID=1917966 RepID=UPI002C631CE9|nr:DUF1565 domain-containing protein [Tetrasphaera sp.]HNQ06144.1 DUF1565 domain-containing protein [Tetrasphaera sp.]